MVECLQYPRWEGKLATQQGKSGRECAFFRGVPPSPLFSRKVFKDKDLDVKYSGIMT
jgi:hypothetical protein